MGTARTIKFAHVVAMMLALAALAPAMGARGGEGNCTVSAGGPVLAGDDAPGLLAVAPDSKSQGARVVISCRSGRVSAVTIRAIPGQLAEARLVLVGVSGGGAVPRLTGGLPSDWVRVESWPLGAESALLSLRVAVPSDAAVGETFSGRLGLDPEESERRVPVTLEIIDTAPLFRDDFGVDPVIGQFSMNTHLHQRPSSARLGSAGD